MNTQIPERRFFLASLKRRPAFLLRHAPQIAAAMAQKLRNRLRLAIAGEQRGLKTRPSWLPPAAAVIASPGFLARLPDYPVGQPAAAPTREQRPGELPDGEDQMRAHRWGPLLQATLYPADAHPARALAAARSWIERPPPRDSVAWETYSACERVANLLLFLARHRDIGAPAEAVWSDFIADSLQWIDGQLEYYGAQTNNHMLNNARALVMGGAALGDRSVLDKGLQIFARLLPEMVQPQGFLRERSSHYQLVVAGWLLDASRFARHAGADAALLTDTAGRMAAQASMLVDEQGALLAAIGDVSPDLSPEQSLRKLQELYGESPSPPRSGVEIRDDWFRLTSESSSVLGNFPVGEYPPRFPTHGHADHGGFAWRCEGVSILEDPGRFRYTPDAISTWQRGASAHNVVLIDGFAPLADSFLAEGAWWPRPYACASLAARTAEGEVELVHDGAGRHGGARRHARVLRANGRVLEVRDDFEGQGEVTLRQCWTLGASFDAFDEATLEVRGSRGRVRFATDLPDARVLPANGTWRGGWCSPEYGVAEPCVALAFESRVRLPARILTRLEFEPCAA